MAEEQVASFRAHLNYLRSLDYIVTAHYPSKHWELFVPIRHVMEHLAPTVVNSRAFKSIAWRPIDEETRQTAGAILKNAWTTELILDLTGETVGDEMIGMANNWASVQAYYASYHAFQALLVMLGHTRPTKHEATQSAFSSFWLERSIELAPWSFGWSATGAKNGPPGRAYDLKIHPWSNPDANTTLDFVSQAFSKMREEVVRRNKSSLRDEKLRLLNVSWQKDDASRLAAGKKARKPHQFPRPRLTGAEKTAVDKSVRAVSILDHLYRLRLKSNYEDATMFVEGPEWASQSMEVHRILRRLVASTLLVHEILIMRLMGRKRLIGFIDEWSVAGGIQLPTIGAMNRRGILADLAF